MALCRFARRVVRRSRRSAPDVLALAPGGGPVGFLIWNWSPARLSWARWWASQPSIGAVFAGVVLRPALPDGLALRCWWRVPCGWADAC